MKYNELKENIFKISTNKKYQILFAILFFIIIVVSSSVVRVSNLPLLIDHTTGENIPLALDPFYFMRIAETLVETNGNLPSVDVMRSPSTNVPWHSEILPEAIVYIYNVAKAFNPSVTIQKISIISPVVFFVIGLILFFFLCLFLSNRKSVAIASTAILAYTPTYLYRTMAGFSDHEAIGMVGVFSFFLAYAISLKYFDRNWKNTIFYSILTGFTTVLVLATWGGAITFVLTIMPFAFLLYWLFVKRDSLKSILFFLLIIISSVISVAIFNYPLTAMLNRFTSSYGMLVPFVLMFILFDFGFSKIKYDSKFSLRKNRILYSLGATALFGIIGLKIIGKNLLQVLGDIWAKLINPFGGGRLGSTVAENAQPYLREWISANGQIIFWLFFIGALISGIEFAKRIKKKELKYLFIGSWVFVVCGILFSRISANSQLFNGSNFYSYSFYLSSLILFGTTIFVLAVKEKIKAESSSVLILSILFFTLINGRSASRVFFLLAPFVAFTSVYGLGKIYDYAKRTREEIFKLILWSLFIIALIGFIFSIVGYYQQVSNQAKHTGPSADTQWQHAMEWTRNNTHENDIFIHWWDYGYWVQSLGKRPTVTDGGHSGGSQADHYIGRYVLTTPSSKSALSYMKTWNVSYLLIDQTDLGKYPAYSRIGGSEDNPDDRFSSIPVIPLDERQTKETSDGVTMIFSGGSYLFEDVIYKQDDKQIFLPKNKAAILGIMINRKISGSNVSLKQPIAIYSYNGVQSKIPLRYAYYEGQLVDYKTGLDSVAFIIPSFDGKNINTMGASIYLSSKVSKSLFAQLFLMDDSFRNYPTVKLAHIESSPVVEQLRNYGYTGGEFIYYHGFRGPIKIWSVKYPKGTRVIEDFKKPLNGVYGRFDNIFYGNNSN